MSGGAALAPVISTMPAGTRLWRVARDATGLAFHAPASRKTRFAPVLDPAGAKVASWYGATSDACAIWESVFHDIRPGDRQRVIQRNEYAGRFLVEVVTLVDLQLVSLLGVDLHAVGMSRSWLIDSTSRMYDRTISAAVRLRAADPTAYGLRWESRPDPSNVSVVLYADRMPVGAWAATSRAPEPLDVGAGHARLTRMATDARIILL